MVIVQNILLDVPAASAQHTAKNVRKNTSWKERPATSVLFISRTVRVVKKEIVVLSVTLSIN